jgi:hypothetical protein
MPTTDEEYAGPYAQGDPYAKVMNDPGVVKKKDLACPSCAKKMKSASGYTLHIKKCCPNRDDGRYQSRLLQHPKGVWELKFELFSESLKVIDPKAYFITSGEAIRKTERLCEDFAAALHASGELLIALKHLKGSAKYLETQWENDRLLLKQKNPRPTSRISQRMQNEQRIRKAQEGGETDYAYTKADFDGETNDD